MSPQNINENDDKKIIIVPMYREMLENNNLMNQHIEQLKSFYMIYIKKFEKEIQLFYKKNKNTNNKKLIDTTSKIDLSQINTSLLLLGNFRKNNKKSIHQVLQRTSYLQSLSFLKRVNKKEKIVKRAYPK